MEMPSEIEEVTSPTHGVQTTNESPKTANIMFINDCEAMDKDVVIKIRTRTPHQPRAVLEEGNISSGSNVDNNNANVNASVGRAVMVTLVPQFVLNDVDAEFIFVVDRSGSMSGSKMTQTRNALELFLRALPPSCYFNIIGFGSSFAKLFKKGSEPYTESTVTQAERHIKKLKADLGGTELMQPLLDIYNNSNSDSVPGNYMRQIIVLTDGEISNTEEVIRLVVDNHKRRSNWRLFTIGVGSSVSRALVEGMARGGRGTCQIIADGERLEPKVMTTLKQALQPALTNVRVDWGVISSDSETTTSATASSTDSATTAAPKTAFSINAPKVGCLVGHRLNEQKQPNTIVNSNVVRNEFVYQAPYNVPPIFSGKRFIVYAFLQPNVNLDKVTVKGLYFNKKLFIYLSSLTNRSLFLLLLTLIS